MAAHCLYLLLQVARIDLTRIADTGKPIEINALKLKKVKSPMHCAFRNARASLRIDKKFHYLGIE